MTIKEPLTLLQKSKEVELYIANTILVMEGFPIMPDFTNTLEQTFGATVQNMDFTNRPVAARLINDWVAKETKNTIKTIVDPGAKNKLMDFHSNLKFSF